MRYVSQQFWMLEGKGYAPGDEWPGEDAEVDEKKVRRLVKRGFIKEIKTAMREGPPETRG